MASAAEVSELRLVLLGNHWGLKNLVGDLLLGKTEFDLFPHRDKCVKVRGTFPGKPVTVIYTPDQLFSTISQQELQQFKQDIKDLTVPGPHVFLLVLWRGHFNGHFTEEHKSRLQSVLESLSEQAFHQSLLLMIQIPDSLSKEEYMREPHIRDMISRCRGRYLWISLNDLFYNKLKPKELFSRICDIVKENDGGHVSLGPSEEDTDLRITLIGKTGSGKSSSANTILGVKTFTAKSSQAPVTKVCQRERTTFDGRRVAVVDTPGLFDPNRTDSEVDVERSKCISLLDPGPHVFLTVLRFERFTQEDTQVVELIKKAFGKRVVEFMIILFTHGDQLQKSKTSIEEFIKDCDKPFKQLLSECGNRFHVFNNRNMENRDQVKDLLQKIDEMVKNRGACYTKLLEAEAATERETERKMKEMEGKMKEMEGKMKEMGRKIEEIERE